MSLSLQYIYISCQHAFFAFMLIDAEAYCKDIDAILLETSALTAVGVNELFTHISEYQSAIRCFIVAFEAKY